jgi:uncharacterized UBP type Zn finger protein
MPPCTHASAIRVTQVDKEVCEECVRLGDSWVHLRMCLTCGNVGCCDDSPNRHATAHFKKTAHPLIRSAQPGETWVWCYVDELVVGELPA